MLLKCIRKGQIYLSRGGAMTINQGWVLTIKEEHEQKFYGILEKDNKNVEFYVLKAQTINGGLEGHHNLALFSIIEEELKEGDMDYLDNWGKRNLELDKSILEICNKFHNNHRYKL